MTARASETSPRAPYDIAIVGSDLLLQALPARPVQVSHALLAAGYSLVVPASWGDELLAEFAIRQVVSVDPRPRVYCACPRVRQRLLATGDELAPHLLSLVAPPVACARYLRQAWPDEVLRITYIGECEGGKDPAIDLHLTPTELLQVLELRGIHADRMPTAFRDVIPPDRRRHWSLAGGCPAPEALLVHDPRTELRIVGADAFPQEVVEGLLGGRPVLLDVADALDCACAGALHLHGVTAAREAVTALEPPRSPVPVLDADLRVDLEYRPRLVLSRASRPATERVAPTEVAAATPPAPPPAAEAPVSTPPPAAPPPTLSPPVVAVRRALAVTPPGVAVTASREEGRPTPPQQLLDSRVIPAGGADLPSPAPDAPSRVQQRHRVARAAARVRGARGDKGIVARAISARRRAASASEPIPSPGEPPPESPPQSIDVASGEDSVPVAEPSGFPESRGPEQAASPVDEVAIASAPADATSATDEEPTVAATGSPGTPTAAPPPPTAATIPETAAPRMSGAIATFTRAPSPPQFAPIPPPPPARPRRLWGLLATVALIMAITVLLISVFAL